MDVDRGGTVSQELGDNLFESLNEILQEQFRVSKAVQDSG